MKYELENGTSFGAMGLNKQGGDGSYNRGLGADVNLVATDFLRFGGFFARTLSPGVRGDDLAGSGDVLLQTQHLSFRALYSDIGANFRPDLGYLTRPGIRKLQAVPTLLASPDFLGIKHANLFYDWNFVMDRGWNLLTRLQKAELLVLFNNGYAFALIPRHEFERIDQPFNIYGSINIPSGSYTWRSAFLGLGSDPTAPLSAIVWLDGGEFWGGTKFATRLWLFSRPVAGLSLQAIWDRAGVDLGSVGDFTSHAVSAVATYAFTPRLSTRATVQYATDNTWRTNFLLDWSYMPGANAYLIFNEQRDLNSFVPQPWLNQLTVAIKFSFTWGLAATPRPAGTMRASLGEGEGACALTGEGQAQLAQLSAQGSRPTRSERDQLRALDLCNR